MVSYTGYSFLLHDQQVEKLPICCEALASTVLCIPRSLAHRWNVLYGENLTVANVSEREVRELYSFNIFCGFVAQQVERLTVNQVVACSSHAGASKAAGINPWTHGEILYGRKCPKASK